ncbi:MAG: hypothetical protein ABIH87_03860 [bacterium]
MSWSRQLNEHQEQGKSWCKPSKGMRKHNRRKKAQKRREQLGVEVKLPWICTKIVQGGDHRWSKKICNYHNPGTAKNCNGCGIPRPR